MTWLKKIMSKYSRWKRFRINWTLSRNRWQGIQHKARSTPKSKGYAINLQERQRNEPNKKLRRWFCWFQKAHLHGLKLTSATSKSDNFTNKLLHTHPGYLRLSLSAVEAGRSLCLVGKFEFSRFLTEIPTQIQQWKCHFIIHCTQNMVAIAEHTWKCLCFCFFFVGLFSALETQLLEWRQTKKRQQQKMVIFFVTPNGWYACPLCLSLLAKWDLKSQVAY